MGRYEAINYTPNTGIELYHLFKQYKTKHNVRLQTYDIYKKVFYVIN